jgi:DNA-binding helix-hairpin-helix protein with protein kinase domain
VASSFYDDRGNVVNLGRELGRGGEGSVVEVAGQPNMVAKIYHQSLDEKKGQKLSTMVGGTDEQLLKIAAWPVRTLHLTRLGPVNGFLMPKVTNYRELHVLHGPKSRLQHFPAAGWPFLLHTAANAARAFAAIHQHGHVVGDVNDRNLLVSEAATVKFIDCDSFQIRSGATTFPCEVGVPTHIAPELQGQSLKNAIRTANHDAFGLAVLVFQLLFMGRHPFSGIPLVPSDMPIEKAIGEYRFAYGPKAASRGMKSPPASAPLEILPPSMAAHFERAFSNQGAIIGRPKATEWVAELDTLSRQLQQCQRDGAHNYYQHVGSCPWCALQTASGVTLFTAVVTPHQTTITSTSLDVDSLIRLIDQVSSPGPLPNLTMLPFFADSPSADVIRIRRDRRMRRFAAFLVLGVGLVLVVVVWPTSPIAGMVLALLALIATVHIKDSEPEELDEVRDRTRQELKRAELNWDTLQERWNRAGTERFDTKRAELHVRAREYRSLATLRGTKLMRLQETARECQLERYLQSYPVASSKISGAGTARLATLRAHGIATAADISPAVINVPGIGSVLADNLLGWRKYLEKRFQYRGAGGLTQSEIAEVDREIAVFRSQIVKDLQHGETTLKQLRNQILLERQAIQPLLEPALRAVKQAEVDLQAL